MSVVVNEPRLVISGEVLRRDFIVDCDGSLWIVAQAYKGAAVAEEI